MIPPGQQVVDQSRLTATDINNSRVPIWGCLLDELKRYIQMRAIPADLFWLLRSIDLLPVRFGIHDVGRKRCYGFTASSEMLFTPNFLLAPRALSEMNW